MEKNMSKKFVDSFLNGMGGRRTLTLHFWINEKKIKNENIVVCVIFCDKEKNILKIEYWSVDLDSIN